MSATDSVPAPAALTVDLREVHRYNYLDVVALCVAPEDEQFVGTAAEAIADFHYIPGLELRAVVVYAQTVGLVLMEPTGHLGSTLVIRRLLIDCKHQRRGYASEVIRQLAGTAPVLKVCVHKEATAAIACYSKLGFVVCLSTGWDRPDHQVMVRSSENPGQYPGQ